MAQDVDDPVGDAIAIDASSSLAAKAMQPWGRMMVLAILAGAFIAFGSIASLIVQAAAGYAGPVRLLSGIAFSVGLLFVMIVGAELFTGNTMFALPVYKRDLTFARMLGAWGTVWLGNLLGSVTVAILFSASGSLDAEIGSAVVLLAQDKLAKAPQAIFFSGILANMLVCLAVWMAMSARTLPAKAVAVVAPVSIFVAAGLEHSIANMSLLPLGWLGARLETPDLSAGLINLALSTLGNIVGGVVLVFAMAYGHDALRADGARR